MARWRGRHGRGDRGLVPARFSRRGTLSFCANSVVSAASRDAVVPARVGRPAGGVGVEVVVCAVYDFLRRAAAAAASLSLSVDLRAIAM